MKDHVTNKKRSKSFNPFLAIICEKLHQEQSVSQAVCNEAKRVSLLPKLQSEPCIKGTNFIVKYLCVKLP